MLDERWSEDVEEIGTALRKLLEVESSTDRVRTAENEHRGNDPLLRERLTEFGLMDLEAGPELFARIAFELGRQLASTPYVESIAALALLHEPNTAVYGGVPVQEGLTQLALLRMDELVLETVEGAARRTSSGDYLVDHHPGSRGEIRVCSGGEGEYNRLQRFDKLMRAARLVGAGQVLLRHGVDYASERTQFGKIIGTYQGVAHPLARAASALDAAELLVRKAAFGAQLESGGDGAPSQSHALMVWAKAVEAARQVAAVVHQVFGGNGFSMEYDIQLYSRRLRSWSQREPRVRTCLAQLGRLVLDPKQRDQLPLIWHYERGLPLPRWVREADAEA